ncbi:flavin-containing monooxygenase [Nocardia sp. NPDC058499]|uniref:flavin-containing monooxygenase n=1 Tax=Nocardia sp. NPDC058499 TaxID=3346530 RepID=UPI003655B190
MLADYGVPYLCFESSDRIGGNWAFGNPNGHSSAYRSLHIDTSKYQLSFRDFPMPGQYPDFPHHSLIKRYLDDYAQSFGLLGRIRFETPVVRARPRPGGGWTLQLGTGERYDTEFLIVANGHHWDPRYPQFPGHFDGQVIHSHAYIDPAEPLELRGKRILVVGLGNSAADITVELSSRALRNTVYLSTRSGSWIVPKYMAGRPLDRYAANVQYVPRSLFRPLVNTVAEFISGDPARLGLPRPRHRFLDAHGTQSVELPLRLGSGDVIPKPDIDRLDGPVVRFTDGTSAEIDVIVYATGYNLTFPFFDPEFVSAPDNRIRLYKRIFRPGTPDLAFAGFAQSVPTLFPFVECQARLIAAYAAGEYLPPAPAVMEQVITTDEQFYLGQVLDRPRHTQQVDFYHYERQLRTRELPEGRRRARAYGPA